MPINLDTAVRRLLGNLERVLQISFDTIIAHKHEISSGDCEQHCLIHFLG